MCVWNMWNERRRCARGDECVRCVHGTNGGNQEGRLGVRGKILTTGNKRAEVEGSCKKTTADGR